MSRFTALMVLVCILLTGCGTTPVAQDLSQHQANEIVALLTSQGISAFAKKEVGGRGQYSVQIRDDHYAEAIGLMHERGLPSERRASVKEMLEPQGLIPSSREMEAMRLDYALAGEIEEMLQTHPAIAAARVVVRLNFLKEGQEPAVAVVAQERRADALNRNSILDVVQRIVPGVKRDYIVIVLESLPGQTEADQQVVGVMNVKGTVRKVPLVSFLGFWRVPETEYAGIALAFVGVLLLVGIGAGGLGYFASRFQQDRKDDDELPDLLPRTLKSERVRKEIEKRE